MTPTPPVVILGAGLTGLSAAYHLDQKPTRLIEREQRVGGHARSRRRDGYTFDVTGHWLHVKDARVHDLVNGLFEPSAWLEVDRRTRVYTHATLLPYPFQANLHGLPPQVVHECLTGFFEAQVNAARKTPVPQTFEAFVVARFGRGIARHFFVPYNSKLWGMHPDQLTPSWISRYVPQPVPQQVIAGALGIVQEKLGYNAQFRYPKQGGIDHLAQRLFQAITRRSERDPAHRVGLETDVQEIDPAARRVKLSTHGDWLGYDRLISTIPLPELISRTPTAPAQVRAAATQLRWVRWRYLDIATRVPPKADYHWVYVPEPDFPFFRVGIYSNACPAMAPPGGAALYVELTDRQRDPDIASIVQSLCRLGAIHSAEDVLFTEVRDIEYAYVVFDHAWESATSTIHSWLNEVGIRSCGRYGAWVYNSMQDCLVEGIEAANWATMPAKEKRSAP
ncbi:MAG: FAD-dependent oxidoreductase [Nannocystaceae bacterium]